MATKPKIVTLTNSSVDILNAIRNNATNNYRDYVPYATPDAESIREIGTIIMDYPALQNEFLNALVNRIGLVLITSKMYSNPLAVFKRGTMEFGETIEEIFVELAKPFQFDPAVAESEIFKREIPDVRSAFHVMNYQKFYKETIQNEQLRQAFLSWEGITDLISKIVDAMYAGAAYDEFLAMKYLLAKMILNGRLYPVAIPQPVAANASTIVTQIKDVSNRWEFMSTSYNIAGVHTHVAKDDQYLIINSNFDAVMDVSVLAAAFHMEKAEFMGHRILVDSFGSLDTDRLDVLFKDDPTYTKLTDAQLTALDAVPAVLVDKKWFMIVDNMYKFTEQYNGEGLYWNYWYHTWKTFSVSPFANSAVLVYGTPAVSSIVISPATAVISAGQSLTLSAVVTTAYFAPKAVTWTATDSNDDPIDGVTINGAGILTVGSDVDANTEITVTATSVYDSTVKDTATITVDPTGEGG